MKNSKFNATNERSIYIYWRTIFLINYFCRLVLAGFEIYFNQLFSLQKPSEYLSPSNVFAQGCRFYLLRDEDSILIT